MDNVTQSTPNTPEISLEIPADVLNTPTQVTPVAQEQPNVDSTDVKPDATVEHQKIVDFIEGKSSEDPFAEKQATSEEPGKTPEESVKTPEVPKAPSRDYTGLNEREIALFKRMSNEAYAELRPIYDNNKKLAEREAALKAREEAVTKAAPRGVYDHEQAYTLTPQYTELSQAANTMAFEREYWVKQLAAVEEGADWKPLIKNAQGQYFEGKAEKATAQAKAELLQKLTIAAQYHTHFTNQLAQVQQNHALHRQQLLNGMATYETKFFPFFAGDAGKKYEAELQSIKAAVPEEFRDHPMAGIAAKALLTVKLLNENNQKLTAALQAQKAAADTAKKTGPTLSTTSVTAAAPAKSPQASTYKDVLAEFDAIMKS